MKTAMAYTGIMQIFTYGLSTRIVGVLDVTATNLCAITPGVAATPISEKRIK
jgi:hypothetical protein